MLRNLLTGPWLGPMAQRRGEVPPQSPESWATMFEEHLDHQILRPWFPRCLDDERGGFRQSYLRDWREGPAEPKSLVFQARMTWVAATVARHGHGLSLPFHVYALHGLNFLREALWDREYGGFFWSEDCLDEKHMYGMAFGILAAAAVYRGTGDPGALTLAKDAFRLLRGWKIPVEPVIPVSTTGPSGESPRFGILAEVIDQS